MPGRGQRGFSLIELMCVIAIILILVGLMMGPILRAYKKAKNFGWENDSYALTDRFTEKMRQHFGDAPEYPSFTAEQLYEAGMIDGALRSFLRDKRVKYYPFSSKSPDEFVVLEVNLTPKNVIWVRKANIKPPP
jgi:prepilin-type N-terminal cleavage/methylation domain-containing protein